MSLEPAADPDRLYLAVGDDVNEARPIFTGDVFRQIEIPGVGITAAIVIAHPCSIRGREGALQERIPLAAVYQHQAHPAEKWSTGFYDRMPLPGLPVDGDYHVAFLGTFGLAQTSDLGDAARIACLSEPGINQLQQRLVFHLTRLEVPAATFQEAFDHTYEEAELLENWATDLAEVDENPAATFEEGIRDGSATGPAQLLTFAERAALPRELSEAVD